MREVEVKQHLKQYCKAHGMTIKELGDITGLQKVGLYKEKNFTLTTVGKILTALDCKFEDLFEIVVIEDSRDVPETNK